MLVTPLKANEFVATRIVNYNIHLEAKYFPAIFVQNFILIFYDISCCYFQDGQTALHQAASAGHGETVAALILGGCDVSLQDFVSLPLSSSSLSL